MKNMTSQQMFDAVHRALEEVDRRLASDELDGSGRFYTDEGLAAEGQIEKPAKKKEAPAA
jgi:hypothetical protein